jgi:hypothetical protein
LGISICRAFAKKKGNNTTNVIPLKLVSQDNYHASRTNVVLEMLALWAGAPRAFLDACLSLSNTVCRSVGLAAREYFKMSSNLKVQLLLSAYLGYEPLDDVGLRSTPR